jgi:serine/threonine protein kinase
MHEPKLLSMLRSSRVIQFYDVTLTPKIFSLQIKESPTKYFIELELMIGGDFHNYLSYRKKGKEYFSEEEAKVVIKSVLEGLSYLHKNNVVHRDIKPGTYPPKF